MFYEAITIYLIAINFLSIVFCIIDKCQAKNGGWRISEKTLFSLCFLGGGIGMYFTMRTVHHKTRHKRFMIGIPLIIILQIIVVYAVCSKIL